MISDRNSTKVQNLRGGGKRVPSRSSGHVFKWLLVQVVKHRNDAEKWSWLRLLCVGMFHRGQLFESVLSICHVGAGILWGSVFLSISGHQMEEHTACVGSGWASPIGRERMGDASLNRHWLLPYWVCSGGGYPGRGSSLPLLSRGCICEFSKGRSSIGEQRGKVGKRTLETLLMLPMKMFAFQVTFFYNALKFTCLVICSADG